MLKRKLLSIAIITVMVTSMLSGCGGTTSEAPADESVSTGENASVAESGTAEESASASELDPYEIKWFLVSTPQEDTALVEAEINKITVPAINATVKLEFVDWGSYEDKMRMALATQEEFDMCFTSNWVNQYVTNAVKGGYREITMDELNRLAPTMMAAIDPQAWEAAKVNGKIYGMMINRILANTPGVLIQKKYAEKYNFDTSTVKSLADMTPLFEQIAQNEPGIFASEINGGSGIYEFSMTMFGIETVSGKNPGGIIIGEKDPEFVNLFETQAMKDCLYLMRDWYNKGIIRSDAATINDVQAELSAQKMASRIVTSNPDTLVNQASIFNMKPEELEIIELSEPYMSTGTIQGGFTSISHTSKDPERCIMFYDMLFSDDRLMNLINYGIEGKHYTKVDDTTIEKIPNTGYYFGNGWQGGNLFGCYKENALQPDWIPTGPDKNAASQKSEILGFSFDPEPVKSELAQCQSIFDEYIPALFTGSVDVDQYLGDFLKKLEGAGSQKIIDEMNNQLDAWRAS